MESLSSESKSIALDILEDILTAIEKVEERTKEGLVPVIPNETLTEVNPVSHCSDSKGGGGAFLCSKI